MTILIVGLSTALLTMLVCLAGVRRWDAEARTLHKETLDEDRR